jgi:predicted DCC family thiol-disulfide oxidoreductase YuxK
VRWKVKFGQMELSYDGQYGFCVRSMAWLLAFDGLQQITIRDFRTDSCSTAAHTQLEKAMYLVIADGRCLSGFEAYRYIVLRVPGLWWLVPLFYVPIFSRLFGHSIYSWIASNRGRPRLWLQKRAK